MCTKECPARDLLNDYVSGLLTLHEHETIEQLIDNCADCQATVAELDESVSTLVMRLPKSHSVVISEQDPDLDNLLRRAKSLYTQKTVVHASTPVLTPDTVLGNYRVYELIGRGGMGQVYRAEHIHMKREVAIKVLSPNLVQSQASQQRFQREVETVSKLKHPNIVAAYDADWTDNELFLVMEYVAGKNLEDIVQRDGPLPLDSALACVRQAAIAMLYAHQSGIIHRDIKPANLLMNQEGHLKLLDLGLARSPEEQRDSPKPDLTSEGIVLGTAAYLSPEQAQDPRSACPQSDIYSLGCTLYFLLTGRPVYEGNTAMEVVFAHREKPLPSLVQERPDTPVWVEQLFRRMTAKSLEERFHSFSEVVEAIDTQAVATRKVISYREVVAGFASLVAVVVLSVAFSTGQFDFNRVVDTNNRESSKEPSEVTSKREKQPIKIPQAAPIDMVHIKSGSFHIGSPDSDKHAWPDEKPQHQVTISRPFALARHEVTLKQWAELMETPPILQPSGPEVATNSQDNKQIPVAGVSWREAIVFCNRLSEKNGLTPFYEVKEDAITILGGNGFRLPTEAEWEFAARAGTQTRWHFGDDPKLLDQFAWYSGNAGGVLQPVGKLEANPWGLHDMYGNVPEWCWDRYDSEYYQRAEPINPSGSTKGKHRVFRGGSVNDLAEQTRSARRSTLGMDYRGFTNPIGLRVAQNLSE